MIFKGDTIVGKNSKSAVITLLESQSKAIITLQMDGRKALDIERSVNRWMSQFPKHFFKSITFDCGKEFSNWQSFRTNMTLIFSFWIQGIWCKEGVK